MGSTSVLNEVAAFKSVDAGTTYALHVAGAGLVLHEASDVTERASAAEANAEKRSADGDGRSICVKKAGFELRATIFFLDANRAHKLPRAR